MLKVEEIQSKDCLEFFVDVTSYAQAILGVDMIQSARVCLGNREYFDLLAEKKKEKIRQKAQKMADSIEKHFSTHTEIEIPGTDGYLQITLINGKDMFFVTSGDDYTYFTGEKTW